MASSYASPLPGGSESSSQVVRNPLAALGAQAGPGTPGGAVEIQRGRSVRVVTADKFGRPLETHFNATDRLPLCCIPYRSVDTTFREGLVVMDTSLCHGLCGHVRQVAALRNMTSWRIEAARGICCTFMRHGLMSLRVGRHRLVNRFNPAMLNGETDSYKVDAKIRKEANDDTDVPAWMVNDDVREFTNTTGCLGSSASCCTCWPLCTKTSQTFKIGPDDQIVLAKENESSCFRDTDITSSNLRNVDYVIATTPVGCCGRTNETCDPLRCNCGCAEIVSVAMGNLPEAVVDMFVPAQKSTEIVREITSRLSHPAYGAPTMLREYPSTTICCGATGNMIVTQQTVTVRKTAYPANCFCCWMCQTSKVVTQPMDKIMAVSVESEGFLYAINNALESLLWTGYIIADNLRVFNVLGAILGVVFLSVPALIYLLLSPMLAIFCCCCQLQEVRLKGNAPDIVFRVHAPVDTGGLNIHEFAVDVINFFRQVQEKNSSILRDYETGAAKQQGAAEAVTALAMQQAQQQQQSMLASTGSQRFAATPVHVQLHQQQMLQRMSMGGGAAGQAVGQEQVVTVVLPESSTLSGGATYPAVDPTLEQQQREYEQKMREYEIAQAAYLAQTAAAGAQPGAEQPQQPSAVNPGNPFGAPVADADPVSVDSKPLSPPPPSSGNPF